MGSTGPRKTGSSGTRIKQSYVANHLQSIDVFEFKTKNIEVAESEKNWNELPPETRTRYTTFSISSIISSIAFLEATVNIMVRRITADESDLRGSGYNVHPSLRAQVDAAKIQELDEKHAPFFKKYDTILDEKGEKKINRGGGIGQDAGYVNTLRNYLVHGTPELLAPDEIPHGARGLPKEVRWSNPFDSDEITMAPLDRCLGSGMIEWAADSCFAYTEEFFNRLDIR